MGDQQLRKKERRGQLTLRDKARRGEVDPHNPRPGQVWKGRWGMEDIAYRTISPLEHCPDCVSAGQGSRLVHYTVSYCGEPGPRARQTALRRKGTIICNSLHRWQRFVDRETTEYMGEVSVG